MPQNDSKVTEPVPPNTLTDEHIVTEPKLPRRSFFIAAGALVAGSAALVACGNNSGQGRSDPDQKKPAAQAATRPDPDQKKADPDQQKPPARPDPDQKKPDSDQQRPPP